MRVLEVYKDLHPWVRGGIERYVSDLGRFLHEEGGHDVSFLVARRSSGLERRLESLRGMDVIEAPTLFRLFSNPLCPGFGHLMGEQDPDIVHIHLPLPTAVLSYMIWSRDIPCVVTYHSDIVRQRLLMPVYGPLQLAFLRHSRAVLATSPRYIETSSVLCGLDNVTAVPIGVDLEYWRPATSDEERSSVEQLRQRLDNRFFLFVGRFRSYKGIGVLLDAWRELGDTNLVMIGDGPLMGRVLERISDEGLNSVLVLPEVDDAELLDYYRAATALVLPSTERSEAYGMVQLEAMACGTPVISTDLPTGVPWVNRDGESGVIVPAGDPGALARAVRDMDGSAGMAGLGEGALARARSSFDRDALFGRVEQAILSALAGTRP